MATEDLYLGRRKGCGVGTHDVVSRNVTITFAAPGTVKDSTIFIPFGSILDSVAFETETAITGSPTSALMRVGTSDTGQEVVADVDAKSQGHITATIVAAFAKKTAFAAADTQLFVQGVLTGGTAGSVICIVRYHAPRF